MNDIMMIKCPVCGKNFKVSKSYIGKKAKCSCSNIFTIEYVNSNSTNEYSEITTNSTMPDIQEVKNEGNSVRIILIVVIVFTLGFGIGYLTSDFRKIKADKDQESIQPVTHSTSAVPKIKIITESRNNTSDSYKQKVVLPVLSDETIPFPTSEDSPSMEKVDIFPDRYVGQKLVFTGCQVSQELKTWNDSNKIGLFMIPVTSKGGKYMGYYPSDDGIAFAVQEKMAETLSNDIQGGYSWSNCTISCAIVNIEGDYYAVIDGIDIYNLGGEVGRKYR